MGPADEEPGCAAASSFLARISTGNFQEALVALVGKGNLSARRYVSTPE
jgi:hypothetical protein